jgi:hypothetical protein
MKPAKLFIEELHQQPNRAINGEDFGHMLKTLAGIARAGTRFDTGHDSDWANHQHASSLTVFRFWIRECKRILTLARAEVRGRDAHTKADRAIVTHTLALLDQRQAIVKLAETQVRLHGHSGTNTNVERWERIGRGN